VAQRPEQTVSVDRFVAVEGKGGMQIRKLSIRNFRGVGSFDWEPAPGITCIIGPGDSCKSTILDALELALGTRWTAFTDVDFTAGIADQPIEITVTVGQLPDEALRENRMGLSLRGWRVGQGLQDEPDDDDEPVVSVRLSVDSSLEPAWELITDRQPPRPISPRDRALFGVVRLGGDAERHLTWAQGSALSRLSSDKSAAVPLLADAYRKARDLLKAGALPALDAVAARVRAEAVRIGAYAPTSFSAGLDSQRSSMSLCALAMHGDGIPLRLAGLGTRRLVALAVQQMSIPHGAIVLVDELEHGLEPHRVRHTLKVLRDALTSSGTGQVVLTTHSATAVVELSCSQLAVCRRSGSAVELKSPSSSLQAMVRRTPEALLSRAVLVCEGKTEVGLLRGLRDLWAGRHDDEPLEARGVLMADGNGSEAVKTALELSNLGYVVGLLRDSDLALTQTESDALRVNGITVFQWQGSVATEERLFLDASVSAVEELLSIAFEYVGEDSVLASIANILGTKERLPTAFSRWAIAGKSETDLRTAIGQAAKKKDWFKLVDRGERVGLVLAKEVLRDGQSPTAKTLAEAEEWAYGQ
jgi:hypothetical protein